MKRTLNKIFLSSFISCLAILSLSPLASAAGTATLSLSSAAYTLTSGSTLTVNVYEDSGTDTVNAVQANFTYPTSSLTFTSIASSSAFNIAAQSTGGSGVVKIGRGATPAVSGKQLVATVYFSVVGTSGSFSLNFDQTTSKVVRSTDNQSESLTYQGATYTISAPASPPPSPSPSPSPTPTSSGSGGASGGGSSAGTTTRATTSSPSPQSSPLTISDITADNLSATSATIHWVTNRPASSEVDYGRTTVYGFTQVDSNLTTNHAVTLNAKNLSPNLYHFRVTSTDANGQVAQSSDMTFDTTSGSLSFNPASVAKYINSKTAAMTAVVAIGIIAIAGALAIHKMHQRALFNQELASHVVQVPGTSVINGKVTVAPDPKQPPQNQNPNNDSGPPKAG